MLWFGWKKKVNELDEKTQEGFLNVKNDIDSVGKWIKHLDKRDKQLFDSFFAMKEDLSSVRDEIMSVREAIDMLSETDKNKQLFKKLPVLDKQTADDIVLNSVQSGVQTDNLYGILKKLSANEKLVVFTLLNSDMKLSYEDLALLLGKERSTVRGQVNSVKQKCEGLIQEITEKNGKKRIYVPDEIKKKMQKYAKVRTGKTERKR
jgi:predicted transcriptional regulator